ncbi:hypothetical protein RND81_09G209200 [Saponaria officinalis]|uniref:Replication factor A C-terminal domain-containing protein n=1 Tax=Saponaria officinalis TaxID=3572 RepID=A0AAW1IPT0_SAPOF
MTNSSSHDETDMIDALTPEKDTWRIKGRITYTWEEFYPSTKTGGDLNFIIVDAKGSKIQANIPKRYCWKYKSSVIDGEVRYLTNFRVSENGGDYRATKHPFKIVFGPKTTCSSTTNTIIPAHVIDFASFNDILDQRLDSKYLIDSRICNTICSSVIFDPEIPEVRDFIRRRAENGINSSSLTLTHLTSHTESFVNELLDLSVRRTISEIKDIQEEGGFVTIATIKGFDTEFRWFTELCKICRAKAEIDDTGKWVCTGRCQGYTKFVVLRYKIRVVVADHTGTATFIIFDSQATDLLLQSAKDVRENQIKHGDPSVYPPELNVLLDRKFIFKVKVDEKYNLTLGWESYGVNKLSEDPDLIERYLHSNQLLLENISEVDSATESDAKFNKEKEYSESTCDNEMVTPSTKITPSKRCHDPSEDDGQFSTTKKQFSKKVECDQT